MENTRSPEAVSARWSKCHSCDNRSSTVWGASPPSFYRQSGQSRISSPLGRTSRGSRSVGSSPSERRRTFEVCGRLPPDPTRPRLSCSNWQPRDGAEGVRQEAEAPRGSRSLRTISFRTVKCIVFIHNNHNTMTTLFMSWCYTFIMQH